MANKLITIEQPDSIATELFKTLRTNVEFSLKDDQKVVMITSATAGDGKSFVTSNLAATFTSIGKKVIVLDLDLRRRRLHKVFKIENNLGLSALLADKNFNSVEYLSSTTQEDIFRHVISDYIYKTEIHNLSLMPAGLIPNNPSELLMNGKLGYIIEYLKEKYDYIFLDVPPVNVVTDTSIMVKYSEAVILVTAINSTKIKIAKEAKATLTKYNANIIGVVANKVPLHKRSYKYKGYEYSYSASNKIGFIKEDKWYEKLLKKIKQKQIFKKLGIKKKA